MRLSWPEHHCKWAEWPQPKTEWNYAEVLADYGALPAYFDEQKHMFIYRKLDSPAWVISNRLGPTGRSGRGVIFAEVRDEALKPYEVTNPWIVSAWGSRDAETDPDIQIFLKQETVREGPPPTVLAIRSKTQPELAGSYALEKELRHNDQLVYLRIADEAGPQKFLFWDGQCWCIARRLDAPTASCDVRCQRRDPQGRNHPDNAVWPGLEVLRGGNNQIDATLLASLRGRSASIAKQFEQC